MKKFLNEIIPAIILAFVASFMLFIFEPITVYSSNTEDFWFGLDILLKCNAIYVLITVCIVFLISTCCYLISKFVKKDIIYNIYIMILNICFITAYIQGNYLAGKLPTLDGTPIEWNAYNKQAIISYVLIVVIIAINILLLIKHKDKYKKIMSYVTIAIFIMICTGLLSTMMTNKQIYIPKGTYTVTNDNINKLSSNNNYLILLVDMEDSKTFDKVLKENGKEDMFNDFTYFPDTLSTYPFTRESIPYILSGEWYEAETDYTSYANAAYNNSKFIQFLKDNKYDVNIYDQEMVWTDNKCLEIDNIKAINSEVDKKEFLIQELKYISFKYLPFSLKKYSNIETLNYEECRKENEEYASIFNQENKKVYDILDTITLQKNNYFQFVHTEGGHYPWDTNGNFEKIEDGTYEDKIEASIKVIEKYLNRIKESGQYDNSIIMVLSDHGNNGYDPVGRQNPILYIKGFNERHDKMQISNKKVSYTDLNDSIFYDLFNGKNSTELLENIDENRIRRFIWYKNYDEMYEQTLDGHAWETEKLQSTGKTYKR